MLSAFFVLIIAVVVTRLIDGIEPFFCALENGSKMKKRNNQMGGSFSAKRIYANAIDTDQRL